MTSMTRLEIKVPDLNDSFSRVVLGKKQYLIRFTWNETSGCWSFGLYTLHREPLATAIRIVPNFPLNLQIVRDDYPQGVFGAYCGLEKIGRKDFAEGRAVFAYVPANQGR